MFGSGLGLVLGLRLISVVGDGVRVYLSGLELGLRIGLVLRVNVRV